MKQRQSGAPLPFAAQCYLLRDRDVVPCSTEELAAWRAANPDDGVVADEPIDDEYGIRTEFVGVTLRPDAAKLFVFQTLVFCQGKVVEQRLSSSWDEAFSSHQTAWTHWKELLA